MQRIYKNPRASDVTVKGMAGNTFTVPAGGMVRLDSWYDRYVPHYITIASCNASTVPKILPGAQSIEAGAKQVMTEIPIMSKGVIPEQPQVRPMIVETVPDYDSFEQEMNEETGKKKRKKSKRDE